MRKLFFALLLLLNISVLHGKGVSIKILLTNNTWLEADLLDADKKGNLRIRLDKREQILRRKEFRLVKMTLPPEVVKAKELLKQNKTREAGKLLDSIAEKYNFPLMQSKIKVLQAQSKITEADYKSVVSLLNPLLQNKITMPQLENASYAHGFLLLGKAYAKLGQTEDAAKAYRRSFNLAVPEYSALANLTLGKMFLEQKKTQDALDCFLENIFVFAPQVPGRKLSLQETINIYRKHENQNLKLYEDMLEDEYQKKSK